MVDRLRAAAASTRFAGTPCIAGVDRGGGWRWQERRPLIQNACRASFEPAGDVAEVRLQLWRGGKYRLLARSGFHGKPVQWLGLEN